MKRNILCKTICLILSLIIAMSFFAGCEKDTPEPIDKPDEPIVPVGPEKKSVTGVVISETEFTMDTEGTMYQLTATVIPADADNTGITWSSSDETVASVIPFTGMVLALNEGTAVITATTDDGGFTASATVTVDFPEIDVEGINLSVEKLTLYVDDVQGITAETIPADATDKSIVWSSSDESVAVVDESGVVTAIKKGTATITAATSNGISASVQVEVKKKSSSEGSSGDSGNSDKQDTTPKVDTTDLSFGQNPKYPSAKLDEKGFLCSDILEKYNAYNKDIVAWLYLPGTNLNFPVAQREDTDYQSLDSYYLNRGLDKKSRKGGACYIDERASMVRNYGQFLNHNTVIYGHALDEGNIFDQLENVTRTDEWFNKESNRYVYINTLKYRYKFKIFATFYLDTSDVSKSVIQDIDFLKVDDIFLKYASDQSNENYKDAYARIGNYAPSSKFMLTEKDLKDTDAFKKFFNNWKDRVCTSYSEKIDGKTVNFGYLKDRDFGVKVSDDDVCVTLYTCADSGEVMKYIVQAVLVAKESR